MDPTLPPGLDVEQLIQEAAMLLADGIERDVIVEQFKQRGIDDEVAAALVDVTIPPFEVSKSGPDIIGTEYVVMGVPVFFEKDAAYARKERRAAKRQRQQKIVLKLLHAKHGANPELDFGPEVAAESQSRPRRRRTGLRSLLIVLAVLFFAIGALAALLLGAWLIS